MPQEVVLSFSWGYPISFLVQQFTPTTDCQGKLNPVVLRLRVSCVSSFSTRDLAPLWAVLPWQLCGLCPAVVGACCSALLAVRHHTCTPWREQTCAGTNPTQSPAVVQDLRLSWIHLSFHSMQLSTPGWEKDADWLKRKTRSYFPCL